MITVSRGVFVSRVFRGLRLCVCNYSHYYIKLEKYHIYSDVIAGCYEVKNEEMDL